MFLVDYLITEAGFDNYGMQPGQGEENEQSKPDIEHEDIKKFILYERLKQIHQKLTHLHIDKADEEFYSLVDFCQNIIEFFNNFEYPEAVRLVDNLVDGVEEKLGIKLPPRVPHEAPVDEFEDKEDQLQKQQSGDQQSPDGQQPQQQQQPTNQPVVQSK